MPDLSYFPGKTVFRDDDSENMFVYQPSLTTLELKKTRAQNILDWTSKGLYIYF